ncbi:fibronectin type III domain-containing protein [Flaviaesturariibacter amylovorans]|uniref:Fibronectin type-III domain-containing protein n=1 Tax=Flaviaesturariibacter amylovorans TaxID=1084520 RepID=A0ABP8HTK0_9BACT
MRKHYPLAAALLAASLSLHAQTQIIGGSTGNGDFEAGSTGWTLVNGNQPNKWVVSSGAAAGFGGAQSLYISSSPAAPYQHQYNTSARSLVYAVIDVPVPAGSKMLWMTYDATNVGEGTFDPYNSGAVTDGLRIYHGPTSTPVVAGQYLNGFIPHGFAAQPTWVRKRVYPVDVTSYAGSSIRIIFEWENDNNGAGSQHPVAIDNVEFFTSCQNATSASASGSNVTTTTASVGWNTVPGATAYQLRYRKVSDPETAATWAAPLTINGNSSYYTVLTGLEPGTDYQVQVRTVGTACNEYGWPSTFRTQVITATSELRWEGATVRFYPNPVRDVLTVDVAHAGAPGRFRLALVDGQGKTVRTSVLRPGRNEMAVSDLPAGLYHAVVYEGGKARSVRLVVAR